MKPDRSLVHDEFTYQTYLTYLRTNPTAFKLDTALAIPYAGWNNSRKTDIINLVYPHCKLTRDNTLTALNSLSHLVTYFSSSDNPHAVAFHLKPDHVSSQVNKQLVAFTDRPTLFCTDFRISTRLTSTDVKLRKLAVSYIKSQPKSIQRTTLLKYLRKSIKAN